jgi:hypothetical protein
MPTMAITLISLPCASSESNILMIASFSSFLPQISDSSIKEVMGNLSDNFPATPTLRPKRSICCARVFSLSSTSFIFSSISVIKELRKAEMDKFRTFFF